MCSLLSEMSGKLSIRRAISESDKRKGGQCVSLFSWIQVFSSSSNFFRAFNAFFRLFFSELSIENDKLRSEIDKKSKEISDLQRKMNNYEKLSQSRTGKFYYFYLFLLNCKFTTKFPIQKFSWLLSYFLSFFTPIFQVHVVVFRCHGELTQS